MYYNYLFIFYIFIFRVGKASYIHFRESYFNFSINQEKIWLTMIKQFSYKSLKRNKKPDYLGMITAYVITEKHEEEIGNALDFIGLYLNNLL